MRFKKGDKVVPKNKTICGPLVKSGAWRRAQQMEQRYLYVLYTTFYGSEEVYVLSERKNRSGGDYFTEEDVMSFKKVVNK